MAADAGSPVPRSRRERGSKKDRPRKKGLGTVGMFLLFGAAPIALLTWFYVQPLERRAEILERVPEGAGGRALKAAICVAVLFGLAKIALPAFHGTGATLKGWLDALKAKPIALRVLLFPVEAIVWLGWFVVQLLFALDAVLIVATAVGTLVLVARILKPDLLSDMLPPILQ
ncbi:MAG: hypothetical protein QNJ90_15590 [Planctomycetota bacterium]|nr:hypothetical protein [Planctomycetota bacterium]